MLLGGPILFMYAWFWLFYSSSWENIESVCSWKLHWILNFARNNTLKRWINPNFVSSRISRMKSELRSLLSWGRLICCWIPANCLPMLIRNCWIYIKMQVTWNHWLRSCLISGNRSRDFWNWKFLNLIYILCSKSIMYCLRSWLLTGIFRLFCMPTASNASCGETGCKYRRWLITCCLMLLNILQTVELSVWNWLMERRNVCFPFPIMVREYPRKTMLRYSSGSIRLRI